MINCCYDKKEIKIVEVIFKVMIFIENVNIIVSFVKKFVKLFIKLKN